MIFDAFQKFRSELLAHARQLQQMSGLGCGFKGVHVGDLERGPEQGLMRDEKEPDPKKLVLANVMIQECSAPRVRPTAASTK